MRKLGTVFKHFFVCLLIPSPGFNKNRDYTRPDLPTCENEVVPQSSAASAAGAPVMPDISAAIAGKGLLFLF